MVVSAGIRTVDVEASDESSFVDPLLHEPLDDGVVDDDVLLVVDVAVSDEDENVVDVWSVFKQQWRKWRKDANDANDANDAKTQIT